MPMSTEICTVFYDVVYIDRLEGARPGLDRVLGTPVRMLRNVRLGLDIMDDVVELATFT